MKKILFVMVLTLASVNVLAQSRSTKRETNRRGTSKRTEVSEDRKGHGAVTMELEFQYVMIGGDEKDLFKDFNCGMATAMGYRYYLHNNFFVEGLFGYRWYSLWMVNDASTTVHNLTLPIHIGGYIDVSDKFALRPFFGPRVDIPVASKVEYKGKSQSADVDPGVTLEFGLDFQFNDTWGLRAKYGLGVGGYKNQNYASLGFTVGI